MGYLRAPKGGCMGYEGGQFLPQHDEVAVRMPSRAQTEAAEKRAERLALDRTRSTHPYQIGERVHCNVTVGKVLVFSGYYGDVWLTIARDQGGNVYVSKGKKWAREGDVIDIIATVKANEIRDGVRQTIVQRVKIAGTFGDMLRLVNATVASESE